MGTFVTRKRFKYPLQNNAFIIPVMVSEEKLLAVYHTILSAPADSASGQIDELGKEKDATVIKIEL